MILYYSGTPSETVEVPSFPEVLLDNPAVMLTFFECTRLGKRRSDTAIRLNRHLARRGCVSGLSRRGRKRAQEDQEGV